MRIAVIDNNDPRYLSYLGIYLLAKTKEGPFVGFHGITQRSFLKNKGREPFEKCIGKHFPGYRYGQLMTETQEAEMKKVITKYA